MKVFVVAGEPSGDRLGASVMKALSALESVSYTGVGGPLMERQGLTSRFPMDELSIMGIAEVLPKYRHLKRRIAETANAILDSRPDAVLTIDSPDFCFRVAALVKEKCPSQHITHYVAPSVWAWRPGRAAKLARLADQVLCLLPFESSYFAAYGLRADFVGHPVVSEAQPDKAEVSDFRSRHGLNTAPTLLILPGSRKSEVSRLLPIFGDSVSRLSHEQPDLQIVTVAAGGVKEAVTSAARSWPGKPIVIDASDEAEKRSAFAAGDIALAASGTVSLELAAAATPMVIAYDMHWITWQVMSRMATTDTATLVNLVSGTRHIPEFLGPRCRPDPISQALASLLGDPSLRSLQVNAMERTMIALGKGGAAPGERAARALLDSLD